MIYCGYQGVGKSTYCRNNPNTTIDLDSSKYKKDTNWEYDYIKKAYILSLDTKKDVFISAHQSVIKALIEYGWDFRVIVPGMDKMTWKARLEFRYLKNPTMANLRAIADCVQNFDKDMEFYNSLDSNLVKRVTATVVTDISNVV